MYVPVKLAPQGLLDVLPALVIGHSICHTSSTSPGHATILDTHICEYYPGITQHTLAHTCMHNTLISTIGQGEYIVYAVAVHALQLRKI